MRFFMPLALMAIAQALTHPLVAMVAARADGGALNVAGLAQANLVSFLLQTPGFGLMTAGMSYGRTRGGFRAYVRVTALVSTAVIVLHLILALPGPSHLLFGTIIGLPASVEGPAVTAFVMGIPVRLLFSIRTPMLAALFNARSGGKASTSALARIGVTLLLAPLFVRAGLVGPGWAMVCLTIPVVFEVLAVWIMSRRLIAALPERGRVPARRTLLRFAMPLSFGTTLMVLSGNLIGAFIARGAAPETMLSVYHLGLSVAGPLSYAASQTQRVVLAFAPASLVRNRAAVFGLVVGAGTGLVSLLALLPPLRDLYYLRLQGLPLEDLNYLTVAVLLLALFPLATGLRSAAEGAAAYRKRSGAVFVGYCCYLVVIVGLGAAALSGGIPGHILGPAGLTVANLAAAGAVAWMLRGREPLTRELATR